MKSITTALSKPTKVISITLIIAVVLAVIIYPRVGRAPKTDVTLESTNNSHAAVSGSNVDLAFAKAGRVEAVMVHQGDAVRAGQTLARLSAPDALGLVEQTKSALALAQAEYANLNLDYAKTKEQQDTLVKNAYTNLLNTPLEATAKNEIGDSSTTLYPAPTLSGNYLLGKEGTIVIKTYSASGGPAFTASGLVNTTDLVKANPVPLGDSGISILFAANTPPNLTWTISIPNTRNPQYAANKNAYDLAVTTREKTLAELLATIGDNSSNSVAKAKVAAAEGAYQAARGAYQNNVITAPVDGTVSFVDENLKAGQSVASGKTVISITAK